MATSAERRIQLEEHLQSFREIADQRLQERISRWSYHIPAIVSASIIICQSVNTVLFASYGYNFGQLFILLDEYMQKTDGLNFTGANSSLHYQYKGQNQERLHEIDVVYYFLRKVRVMIAIVARARGQLLAPRPLGLPGS